jgi:hypothetical protein
MSVYNLLDVLSVESTFIVFSLGSLFSGDNTSIEGGVLVVDTLRVFGGGVVFSTPRVFRW